MRIIELSTDRLPSPPVKGGAIERYVYEISQELSKLGVEVHLVSIGDKYRIRKRSSVYHHVYSVEDMNLLDRVVGSILATTTSEYNSRLFYVNRVLLHIFHRIQDNYGHIDAIHSHYFTTAFAPILFRNLSSGRTLLVSHHHNVPKDNLVNKVLARCYDVHLAVSKFVKNEVVRRLGVEPRKVRVVHNAIDTSKFVCNENVRRKMRDLYNIPHDDIVLLYMGRITYEKGLHHLIRSFKIVRERVNDRGLMLLIVGPVGQFDVTDTKDLAYFHYIQKMSRELGIHESVRYLGHVANIADVYAVADVVVVPSIWQDACPSTVLEAMASCKPVVAYPVGGIPELFEDLEYDFLAKSIDPGSLADKIVYIIKHIENIDLRRLREHVDKKFSTWAVAKSLKNILETYMS